MRPLTTFGAPLGALALLWVPPAKAVPARPDFTTDVRPVMARHCFKCHGPDDKARKARLRLDVSGVAKAPAKSGEIAIVPGIPDKSELVRRIRSTDPDEVMPPPEVRNPLTDAEKEILTRWIEDGAEYKEHWAFVAPMQTPLPGVKNGAWPRNGIDYFILARLESEGLEPSPEADRVTLARRVYLDLLGLPPLPDEVDAFVNDGAPDAYDRLVDRLQASPRYGERWARRWLDLARYADTNGYEKDRPRSIWPYRDWVINAFNDDMPFDQFTIEQLAGDLLPDATALQRIATGFNRNSMLNEEGGTDPLEFRFYATVDRLNTTATTWLGLTLGCAQCHTHKYDPIPHPEYYRMMAFLNNADEPEVAVPDPAITAKRRELESKIASLRTELAARFPPPFETRWHNPPIGVTAKSGATIEPLEDHSVRVTGSAPERDTYTVVIDSDSNGAPVSELRVEALADPAFPKGGPGRAANGNFVLSTVTVTAAPRDAAPGEAKPVRIVSAHADFSQEGYPVSHAIDADPKTGWAIEGADNTVSSHTATFVFETPVAFPSGTRWTIQLDQAWGQQHTLGRLRLSLGARVELEPDKPLEVRRRENLERKFNAWVADAGARATRWTPLRPVEARSNVPLLSVLEDGSVFSGGDQSKRDVYDLKYRTDLRGITAIRLEALTDERLPANGPGRVYYEGKPGEFFLSEFTVTTGGKPVKLARASQTFSGPKDPVSNAIDGDPLTGWGISGGSGRPQTAVFNIEPPLDEATDLALEMVFEKYYSAPLGRFRISVTNDKGKVEASDAPADVQDILAQNPGQWTGAQRERVMQHYLDVAPDLAGENKAIEDLRRQLPEHPTTLVFSERPPETPRPTFVHHRGEFLQPGEKVEPGVLSILSALPKDAPRNRLTFARWIVDAGNPLTARVIVNRQWAAFFGRGIVRTQQDFGFTGDAPSHPGLLDWLALEFVGAGDKSGAGSRSSQGPGWSLKGLNRLIVTSATYRQASRVTPGLVERDPGNILLARGPRFRVEAEMVRDSALRASGLLTEKLGGPSVFPPQPASVTTEGAYGKLTWSVSEGPDRYRRGLYTFTKRTAPYAMFNTFDAPSGEACVARREVSNTPLQALTLLNDAVFVEAAQALGKLAVAHRAGPGERAAFLFRRCLSRAPTGDEQTALVEFYEAQKARLANKELDAKKIAGPGEGDAGERAAWTLVARALLNLDEAVTKS